jgi:hypothetical protein
MHTQGFRARLGMIIEKELIEVHSLVEGKTRFISNCADSRNPALPSKADPRVRDRKSLAHGIHFDQGAEGLNFPEAALGVLPEVVL